MISWKRQRLLIVAPHPDDETLGCTGLIRTVKNAGGKVYVLFLTVGTIADYSKVGSSKTEERIAEIGRVARFLGYDGWRIAFSGNQYHLRLDQVAQKDLIDAIERGPEISLEACRPTIVATTKEFDYNQDHRMCAAAVFAATRPAPTTLKPLQRIVLGYESVPVADWATGMSPNPNFFVELSKDDVEAKVKTMQLYASQVRTGTHPRAFGSIRNHAAIRGMQCGVKAAEAYVCYRLIV